MIVHLVTQDELKAARTTGAIAPDSLRLEGFVHCSAPHQAIAVASRFYPARHDLVALLVDDTMLGDALRWESPAHPDGSPALPSDEFFPHLYVPLSLDAVMGDVPLAWNGAGYDTVGPLHTFRIVALADYPNLWQRAAEWSFTAWSHEFPNDTVQTYLDQYTLAANPGDRLVEVYAAIDPSTQLLGLATLVDDDELPGVIEPGPWIAAVWVDPAARLIGVGGSLIRHATLRARSLGVRDLYLYTEDQQAWYERKGWARIREATLNALPVTVMTKRLS